MTYTIEAKNLDETTLRAIKSVLKLNPQVKIKTKKEVENKQGFIKRLNTPKYYTLETSPAIKKIDDWAKANPELAQQADKELEEEMKGYYENYNSAQGR